VSYYPCNTVSVEQRPREDGFWQEHQKEGVIETAFALYGDEAATAAAYCALEAWTERRSSDYHFWFDVFLQLRGRLA